MFISPLPINARRLRWGLHAAGTPSNRWSPVGRARKTLGYRWRSRRAGGGRVGGEGFSPPAEARHVAQARPDPARAEGNGAHRPSRLSQGQPPAQAEGRALGAIFADADFADLFPKLGQP